MRWLVGVILFLVGFSLLLLVACSAATTCERPNSQVGGECCLDADDNKICDKDEQGLPTPGATAKPAPAPTPAPVDEVKLREKRDVTNHIGRTLNYFVPFEVGKVPANHYEYTTYPLFTFYGSTQYDIIEIKDEADYFENFDEFTALLKKYADARHVWRGTQLEKELKPKNQTFTMKTDVTPIVLATGQVAEIRQRAAVYQTGQNYHGDKYTDWVDPFGVVTIYVPCGPNLIVAVWGVNTGSSKFAANYEDDAYWKELENNLDEVRSNVEREASEIARYCSKPVA